ncbi:MAG: PilN domain-containing protein [Myxococcota bacterium]
MIRINLLPEARKQARTTAGDGNDTIWFLSYLGSAVVFCIVLAVVYFLKHDVLEAQQRSNAQLNQRIQQIKAESARLDLVKSQLERSQRLEAVVSDLNKGRTGPTRLLMELSQVLSAEGGPTIDPLSLEECRRINPLCGFNRSWDVRRLWLEEFQENEREFIVKGRGKTNEDVAEFLNRLSLSELFESVTLTKTEEARDDETGLELIRFELTGQVTY